MSESIRHLEGVAALERFVLARADRRDDLVLYRDAPDSDPQMKPPLVGGFRPDLYARSWRDGAIVIGEAKTARDLETPRSLAQLAAFIAAVATAPRGEFVLSVPVGLTPAARGLLRTLAARCPALNGRVYCISPEIGDMLAVGAC